MNPQEAEEVEPPFSTARAADAPTEARDRRLPQYGTTGLLAKRRARVVVTGVDEYTSGRERELAGPIVRSLISRSVSYLDPHFPYLRPLRLGWNQAEDGSWHYVSTDPHRWEVICAQCGDTDGPADSQAQPARRLRGPYEGKHAAHRAVKRHSAEHPTQKLELGPMSDWPVI